MSFTTTANEKVNLILAQNFDTGGKGSGGVDDIVNAGNTLASDIATLGAVVFIVAFLISVVRVAITMKNGGSFGDAFSGLAMILVLAIVFGAGSALVGWAMGFGGSLT